MVDDIISLVSEYFLTGVVGIVAISLLLAAVFTVRTQTAVIVETFGKFSRIARPGLNFLIPIMHQKAGILNLKVMQLDVKVETKTSDDVFVHTTVSVQYQVIPAQAEDAYYKLNNPKAQIESYVFDVVRAEVPKMELDEVFSKKGDIAEAVKRELAETMGAFGYSIVEALVTEVDPAQNVKDAMNEINEQKRLRVAAEEKGEAARILLVKAAEAEAEGKKLQGEGIAAQRKAIAAGFRESVETMQAGLGGDVDAGEVLKVLLLTQHYDTMSSLAADGTAKVIFATASPNGMSELMGQLEGVIGSPDYTGKPSNSNGSSDSDSTDNVS